MPNAPDQRPNAGRVLCLTASVGSGHTRAAQAVQAWTEQLAREGSMAIDSIRVEDVLAHAHPLFRSIYRGGYLDDRPDGSRRRDGQQVNGRGLRLGG